jgi:hypothetical protein
MGSLLPSGDATKQDLEESFKGGIYMALVLGLPSAAYHGTLPYEIDDKGGHDPEEHGRQGSSEYGNLEYEIKGDKININAANFTKGFTKGLTDRNEVMKYAAERLSASHPDKFAPLTRCGRGGWAGCLFFGKPSPPRLSPR